MRKTGLILLAALAAAAPLWADEPVDERRPLYSTGAVEIEMISGTIKVVGWDRSEVEITGRLHDVSEQLEVDSDGEDVSIEILPPRGRHHNLPAEVIKVRMPRGARLEIETISASIDVTELEGDLSLSSISGEIHLAGDLRRVEVETVSGTIILEDGGDLNEGSFESVSGTIRARADFQPRGRFEFETISGNIELRIPAGTAADFELETFSGVIKNKVTSDEPRRTDPPLPSQELSFSIGSGGARISATSFSGAVRILKD